METYTHGIWSKYIAKATLQDEDYKGEIFFQIGGNTHGGSILQQVLTEIEDGDFKVIEDINHGKFYEVDEEGYITDFILVNGDGDTLLIDYGCDPIDYVTAVEIVKVEDEEIN